MGVNAVKKTQLSSGLQYLVNWVIDRYENVMKLPPLAPLIAELFPSLKKEGSFFLNSWLHQCNFCYFRGTVDSNWEAD